MSQYPEFDLRVVCSDQDLPLSCVECLSDLPSEFLSYRDVLKVGLSTAYPSGLGDRLLEMAMDPSVRCDKRFHPLYICGSEFGQVPVFQHLWNYRVIVLHFFKYVSASGISLLRLLAVRKLKFIEEDIPQLLGGFDIELFSGKFIYLFFQFFYF